MFAYLKGKIVAKSLSYVVLETNSIGYRIFVPGRMLDDLEVDREVLLHTYLQVREDDLSLYGFTEPETLSLFETLLTISGVGPKLAINIVNAVPSDVFRRAILQQELSVLTKIPGIGKKTAQRLILELKDKLAGQDDFVPGSGDGFAAADDAESQVMAALVSLGYRSDEAMGALRAANRDNPELRQEEGVLLRASLKYLGSR